MKLIYDHISLLISILLLFISLGACSQQKESDDIVVSAIDRQITDQEISDAVYEELIVQVSVPAHNIDVNTEDGIVKLSGSTDNILAKEKAEDIALSVREVKGVINLIDVDPVFKPDDSLKIDINNAIILDPAVDIYELDVQVDTGYVKLQGNVDSWQEKKLAEEVVKSVSGVEGVENNISFEVEENRDDFEIKAEIERILRSDVRIDDGLIGVEVEDGVVILTGMVGSGYEKERAIADSWVAGVNDVNAEDLEIDRWARDNDLRLDKYILKSDEQILLAIQDAFQYDPRIDENKPEVVVNDGFITLNGTVSNLRAKRAAGEVVKSIVGVVKVKNQIKVRPEKEKPDESLVSDVRTTLKRDPYIEKYEISVVVVNQKVFLNGEVDSFFEKSRAEKVVSAIEGVVDVENELQVENPEKYEFYPEWTAPFPEYNRYTEKQDKEIKEDVRDQLWWSPYVNEDEISIEVEDGIVILEGEVDTWSEWRAAMNNAMEAGALGVENKLEVKYKPYE